jgi:hypothetical protein
MWRWRREICGGDGGPSRGQRRVDLDGVDNPGPRLAGQQRQQAFPRPQVHHRRALHLPLLLLAAAAAEHGRERPPVRQVSLLIVQHLVVPPRVPVPLAPATATAIVLASATISASASSNNSCVRSSSLKPG